MQNCPEIAQLVEHKPCQGWGRGSKVPFSAHPHSLLFSFMNLYIRYFEKEALVSSVDEAIDFLTDIPEIEMTNELADDIKDYAESNIFYPKRSHKVRPRVYFIIIKTEAATMTDFKQKKALRTNAKE